jgi:hypothetical protein
VSALLSSLMWYTLVDVSLLIVGHSFVFDIYLLNILVPLS